MSDDVITAQQVYDHISDALIGDGEFHAYVLCNMGSNDSIGDAEGDVLDTLCEQIADDIASLDEALPRAFQIIREFQASDAEEY